MDTNPENTAGVKTVYLLFHTHQLPDDEEDSKLIGVYAARADAESAQARARTKPGFKEHDDGFMIDEYEVGKDHWEEGFRTISAN
ncbi:MAG TPA: hypothetical protein VK178_15440 [Opitutaceae bacterium]|nr:hypothetical protein [Opitutaceae bacterium]